MAIDKILSNRLLTFLTGGQVPSTQATGGFDRIVMAIGEVPWSLSTGCHKKIALAQKNTFLAKLL